MLLLRLEGLVELVGATAAYHALGGAWWRYLVLFLTPDLSMPGFLKGPGSGSLIYNLGHNCCVPAVVVAAGLWMASDLAVLVGTIWIAHIGFDRVLGYGLRYPTGFRDTHLQRV